MLLQGVSPPKMEPINMIIIYYSDRKLPERLYFLEADMIKKKLKKTEDFRSLAQKLKIY